MKEFKKRRVARPKPLTSECRWLLRFGVYDGVPIELAPSMMKDHGARCLKPCPEGRKYCDTHVKVHQYRQWTIRCPEEYEAHLYQRRLREEQAAPDHDPTDLEDVEGFDLRFVPEVETEMPKRTDAEVESTQREINAGRRHHKDAAARQQRKLESSPGYMLLQQLSEAAQQYSRRYGWHDLPGITYDKLIEMCRAEHRRQ